MVGVLFLESRILRPGLRWFYSAASSFGFFRYLRLVCGSVLVVDLTFWSLDNREGGDVSLDIMVEFPAWGTSFFSYK